MKIEKVFLLFVFLFGLIFIFITPPFQSVDENFHFYRAYGIASGQFVAEKQGAVSGSMLSESLSCLTHKYDRLVKNINEKTSISELSENLGIKLSDNEVFTGYSNTALYSPAGYIPQSMGVYVAKILNLSPLIMLYFGRLFNLIMYAILGYYAIKVIPVLKLAVFLILLMPMNLSLAASLSTDAVLISVSLIFIGLILKCSVNNEKISIKNLLLLALLSTVLALIKHHFLLLPLLFLIPPKRFCGKYWQKISVIILPAIFACIIWSKAVAGLYVPLREGADMYAQLSFILHNPLEFIAVLFKTILIKTFRIIVTMIGVLGWQDTRLDILTYLLYPLAIIYAVLNTSDRQIILSKFQILLLSSTLTVSYLLIVTYMYLSWSLVGSGIVMGLNGKYFVTLLLPFLILLAAKSKFKFGVNNNIIYAFCFLILLSTVFSLLTRFYNMFPNLYYQI